MGPEPTKEPIERATPPGDCKCGVASPNRDGRAAGADSCQRDGHSPPADVAPADRDEGSCLEVLPPRRSRGRRRLNHVVRLWGDDAQAQAGSPEPQSEVEVFETEEQRLVEEAVPLDRPPPIQRYAAAAEVIALCCGRSSASSP